MEAKPVYDNYEISGCVKRNDGGGEYVEIAMDGETPDFWTLYGHIDGGGIEAIGDFKSREQAEAVYSRITGLPFSESYEADGRLRLMHAAPALLEALEPYAVMAKNRVHWAYANGDDGELLEQVFSKLLGAYAQATSTPPGAAAVARQIERLVQADFFGEWDSERENPEFVAVEHDIPGRWVTPWSGLDRSQQLRALETHVDWDGFDWVESGVVTRNVIEGKPKERWFEGTGGVQDAITEEFSPAFRISTMSDKPEAAEMAEGQDGRLIRDTTRSLVKAVMLDVWPSIATVVDFGINTQEHYEALYYPLRHGDFTPEQLDAALGKGLILTELVNAATHNPHKGIVFRTGWDGLVLEPEDCHAGGKPACKPSLSDIADSRAEPARPVPCKEKDDGFEL